VTGYRTRSSVVAPEASVAAGSSQNHMLLVHQTRDQVQDIAVTESVGLQPHHELQEREPQGRSFRWSRCHD
jgi:hypothetical protein